ncbi:uncharacterized protein MYCFIDRAFT_171396 [Pseudocercospora fijiensis CIRAD86]|uniref:Uncharacterized protein n=1 Tax=Pseudocercospora fijiensis (strain CIRAD86) TaxID=383855 RepID=M3B819_PSEFD|nr:uncharacterized protein MYCFIDRAFT_171396 [Pseudocercospora fijiensis CIRAD86]EME85467.1 hypothetical protein MYCFIDRAFT_171396 [Pseudocercospora fijiensis CIRAD86]
MQAKTVVGEWGPTDYGRLAERSMHFALVIALVLALLYFNCYSKCFLFPLHFRFDHHQHHQQIHTLVALACARRAVSSHDLARFAVTHRLAERLSRCLLADATACMCTRRLSMREEGGFFKRLGRFAATHRLAEQLLCCVLAYSRYDVHSPLPPEWSLIGEYNLNNPFHHLGDADFDGVLRSHSRPAPRLPISRSLLAAAALDRAVHGRAGGIVAELPLLSCVTCGASQITTRSSQSALFLPDGEEMDRRQVKGVKERRWRYRVLAYLLLTVLQDLQAHPEDGHFAKFLAEVESAAELPPPHYPSPYEEYVEGAPSYASATQGDEQEGTLFEAWNPDDGQRRE